MLADYRSNIPQARDAEVLDLLAVLATRISASISQEAGGFSNKRKRCGEKARYRSGFFGRFQVDIFFRGKDTRNEIYTRTHTHIYIFFFPEFKPRKSGSFQRQT